MKKIMLMALLTWNSAFAQLKNGEQVPEIEFKSVLNSRLKSIKLSQLKGKIVWIEFWATWCGPCLSAMPHLQQLQAKYKDKLQVITLTDEGIERTEQFLKAKPSNLWFAVDTANSISKMFPHRLIPHSLLISATGSLIAATLPENITETVIDSLLNGKTVHLPEKKDNLTTDFIKDYFFAEDTLQTRFLIQPEIKGGPGMMVTFADKPAFKERRLTFINVGVDVMYRKAFGDFSYGRTINKTGEKNEEIYCLDLLVKDGRDLIPTLKNELLKRFALQAKTEKRLKEVYVLKITDLHKFNSIPRNKSGRRTYLSRHGEIDQESITMLDFADFLENFGTYRSIIIDETHNTDKLDIKFSFQPENPSSLNKILSDMGLSLEKTEREVEFLVLYKNNEEQ
ncbi:redoxin family protein [Pedobacter sp. ASV28]|uniref:redoxin family protein n=1 Tax=Pedobacter sp. ASV28 TaxID=2795123 RepID=UPI0018ED65B5|nr:redoxin family protein [Pedobacter sp. ASV28]